MCVGGRRAEGRTGVHSQGTSLAAHGSKHVCEPSALHAFVCVSVCMCMRVCVRQHAFVCVSVCVCECLCV